jgi:hypothetical protein
MTNPDIPDRRADGASPTTDVYRVVPIPPRPADQWALDGRYVENVWSEFLGPTATLLARRLADRLDIQPHGYELSLTDTARSLGVPPSKARAALLRLDRYELITVSNAATVGVGLAPSVGFERLHRLSERALAEHLGQLAAAVDPPPSRLPAAANGRQPGSASWARRSPGRSL